MCCLYVYYMNIEILQIFLISSSIQISFLQIDRYNEHHEAVEQLTGQQRINGWLNIDLNPLKYALLNHVCKWSHQHKRWLLKYVEHTLNVSETTRASPSLCKLIIFSPPGANQLHQSWSSDSPAARWLKEFSPLVTRTRCYWTNTEARLLCR